jgi:RES domain-containing protein
MTLYRMHRAQRLANDDRGARMAGGRWNPIGTPMLYTAEHLSLACLEVLVHLDKRQLPRDYVWSKTELAQHPERLSSDMPTSLTVCQALGENWIRSAKQLAICVPSAVIPEEYNILLNPRYPSYQTLVWSDPRPFQFDPRRFVAEPHTL